MSNPSPGEEQPCAPGQAGPDQLGNSSAEKDLRDGKQNRSQQCALVAFRY